MPESLEPRDLVRWFRRESRDLPWRRTEDPYRIWVAEIMLQQTRVSTVVDYYHRFVDRFPNVESLAEAERDQVLKLWEGLGYYARARWLHDAARTLVNEYDGVMPRENEERQKLKGIGGYTAAAIGAFAFNQADPVLDGNVARVVARVQGLRQPVSRADTERRIAHYLASWLDETNNPGTLSEAFMELGSLICTPANPDCDSCPIRRSCVAFDEDLQGVIPVTDESPDRLHHEVTAGVIERDNEILISRRPENGMLGGLWEFPGGKKEEGETLREAMARELHEELGLSVNVGEKLHEIPHEYSHMTINLHVFNCEIESGSPESREGQRWKWVPLRELKDYPFPKSNHPIVNELSGRTEPSK